MVSGNVMALPCLSDLGQLAVFGLKTDSHCGKVFSLQRLPKLKHNKMISLV